MSLNVINLPDEIVRVIDTIEQNGYEAYVVGGAVRDFLMGRCAYDYDVTTNARPEKIAEMFPKVIETGLKHGTVTVVSGKYPVEVTSYRVDGEYKNHRKPETVEFSDNLAEDLKRRDFTINALAYNPKTGIVDLFGGRADIAGKIIRTVGDADTRFNEDALRMLRAVRFSACLGFDISADVTSSILKNMHLMDYVSKERIKAELDKILLGDFTEKLCDSSKFIDMLISGFDESCDVISALKNTDKSLEIRWAVLLSKTGCNADEFMRRYKFSNTQRKAISTLIEYTKKPPFNDKVSIKNVLRKVDDALFEDILKMNKDAYGHELYMDIKKNNEPYRISHLAVSGSDIIHMVNDKRLVGKMLEHMLDVVIQAPDCNTKKDLMKITEVQHV